MDVVEVRTPGLGDTSYLLTHDGVAVVVDPQRDVDRFERGVAQAGADVAMVLETHLHNDYVSGARELARRTGADLVLPAGAGAAYAYRPAFHGEELEVAAGLALRPLHTPGHTPEHTSYVVLLDGHPVAVFSGGSLLVGSAGRTDLLGPERAHQLAVLQHGSVHRLAELPGEVALYPTHGAGSFCASGTAGPTTSTVGREREDNPVLAYEDAEGFAEGQLAGLAPHPRYYRHMGPINLLGPPPMPSGAVRRLDPGEVAELGSEVQVVDIRPREAFAAGHVPGALGVELGDEFAPWVGWLVPFGAPIVLVAEGEAEARSAARELARIGFDDVRGFATLDGWDPTAGPLATFPLVDLPAFIGLVREGLPVLDVRAPAEWEEGHLAGSVHAYVPDLADGPPQAVAAAGRALVACASGFRAAIAAGLLERAGVAPAVLDGAGIPEVGRRLRRQARAPA